jgi:hypothetical protein
MFMYVKVREALFLMRIRERMVRGRHGEHGNQQLKGMLMEEVCSRPLQQYEYLLTFRECVEDEAEE